MKDLVLIGGGGHCRSCIDVIEAQQIYRIVGIVDLPEKVGSKVLNYPVIGCDDNLPTILQQYNRFLITLGQIKSPARRIALYDMLLDAGALLAKVVSPRAYVSPQAFIGDGTIVMHDALVNAGARVGVNGIINSKALIEHDAQIGDHCHISTGAIINGGVEVGAGCFVGSGAITHQGVRVGAESLIAAGALIAADLPAGSRYPGRRERRGA